MTAPSPTTSEHADLSQVPGGESGVMPHVPGNEDGGTTDATPPVSYTTAPPRRDRWAHRRTEPRPFALLWILYLIIAALVAFGSASSFLQPTPDMYRHATRVLFFLAALGVSLFWPMLRLSQSRPASPRASVLLDLTVLLPPLQCVIWPQLFDWMARWSVVTVATVATAFTAWALLIGALLALALRCERAPRHLMLHRSLWMTVFLALTVIGPACSLWVPGDDRVERWLLISPVGCILEMVRDRPSTGRSTDIQPEHWRALVTVTSVALALWLLPWLPTLRSKPSNESVPIAPGGHLGG